jgi:hypothetical protein
VKSASLSEHIHAFEPCDKGAGILLQVKPKELLLTQKGLIKNLEHAKILNPAMVQLKAI